MSKTNHGRRLQLNSLAACVLLMPALLGAAPLVFEETARISLPDPTFPYPLNVAVEGDTIIASSRRIDGEIEHHVAFLFRRQSNGQWLHVNTLTGGSCNSGEVAEDTCHSAVSIRNGVAAFVSETVQVLVRSVNGDWIAAPSNGHSGPGDAAVGTGVIFTSETVDCVWASRAFRKNSTGVWSLAATFPGPSFSGCDSWGRHGSDADISAGNRLIVGNSDFNNDVHIFEPNGTTWTQTAALTSPVNGPYFGDAVAIDDSRAYVSGPPDAPIHVFSRSAGNWIHTTNIVPPDATQYGPPSVIKSRNLVVAGFVGDPHRSGSVGLFESTQSGAYRQVARLVGSDGGSGQIYLGQEVDAYVSGSFARIVSTGAGGRQLYVFDLNRWGTTPAPLQEDFQQGSAANWTPMAGSTFTVASSSGSNVYRQSSLVGDSGSFITSIDWTNQAIEADVKPTAFSGANHWAGLAVRRTDANNYYYITLRQTNVLELKRMVNGAFVTLASVPVSVVLNRNYRLRLEAVGTLLRAYLNGRMVLQASDTALTHGHAGVRLYKARADFDNVVVSQNPRVALLDAHLYRSLDWRWSVGPGVWTEALDGNNNQRLVQQDITGDARAVALVDADNQIVQARALATSFAGGTGVRWFGVMARYVDAQNYYYVTLRSDNTVSLRKLVNGAIHVLDTAPLTVSTGTYYTIRLEAVGSSLRAYVNGNLLLEASDASHAKGKYGPVMYKAAARYDDLLVWEP